MTLTTDPGPATSRSCDGVSRAWGGRSLDGTGEMEPYLLVPAEQDAHCLATALASATGVDLGESGSLWGDVARAIRG
jgi:hypothetical protein